MTAPSHHVEKHHARRAATVSVIMVILVLSIHWPTAFSIVSIWAESNTFSHGFLVFPIVLWLVWRNRGQLAGVAVVPVASGFLALLLLGVLWLLASEASVRVMQQFAVIAMIPAALWAVMGTRFVSRIRFPLFYLVFAVPFGEFLIPPLMDFTALFAVKAVSMSGVLVYRDGLFFSIPGGDFEVARACSGVRYLIASLALGTLYAYLNYRSIWRRAAFILLSVCVPIVANGVRAYGIVMLAHLSDMQYAAGVDHIIYGWLFFGFVMLILFWLGSAFRDVSDNTRVSAAEASPRLSATRPGRLLLAAITAIIILSTGPVAAHYLSELHAGEIKPHDPQLLRGQGLWQGPDYPDVDWIPGVAGAHSGHYGHYTLGDNSVSLYVYYFVRQTQGDEMVNSRNQVYDNESWSLTQESKALVHMDGEKPLDVIATDIRSVRKKRLVWHWYTVSGRHTASRIGVKLNEIRALLSGKDSHAYMVAVSTEYRDDRDSAVKVLESFMRANKTVLLRCLDAGHQHLPECAQAVDHGRMQGIAIVEEPGQQRFSN